MLLPDPQLPPMLTGHSVKAPDEPFVWAVAGAAAGRLGAADFVWARNTSRATCALVLEPECSMKLAQQMQVMAEVAVAEALGAACPPQVAVELRWPGQVIVNGAYAGCVRLAAPSAARDLPDVPPQWLVVALEIAILSERQDREPGETPMETTLWDEGCTDVTRTTLLEALGPRLLAWIHTWQHSGFRPLAQEWLYRAEGRRSNTVIDGRAGLVLGRDEEAGLMFKPSDGGVVVLPFGPHVIFENGAR